MILITSYIYSEMAMMAIEHLFFQIFILDRQFGIIRVVLTIVFQLLVQIFEFIS